MEEDEKCCSKNNLTILHCAETEKKLNYTQDYVPPKKNKSM
jgi:hypothetical protein